ncbi:hypothetical protein L1987_09520 [Smallanthus sonchifolius]|uniref:Uncharacterized protein n=1 Tax=Smallanthus sonchifolius TaxID=185202 RepID=A0ACB9JP10_9ASTR|nr:hypothetical protein L1987_09520 [Smallanthus sonchifolius]
MYYVVYFGILLYRSCSNKMICILFVYQLQHLQWEYPDRAGRPHWKGCRSCSFVGVSGKPDARAGRVVRSCSFVGVSGNSNARR